LEGSELLGGDKEFADGEVGKRKLLIPFPPPPPPPRRAPGRWEKRGRFFSADVGSSRGLGQGVRGVGRGGTPNKGGGRPGVGKARAGAGRGAELFWPVARGDEVQGRGPGRQGKLGANRFCS